MECLRASRLTKSLIVACAIVAVAYSIIIYSCASDKFVSWLNTLVGTLISVTLAVVVGILLFNLQTEETAKREKNQLCESLKVELGRIVSVLDPSKTPTPYIVYLSPIVLEKAIGSGHFDAQTTASMINLMSQIDLYRGQIEAALGTKDDPQKSQAIDQAGKEGTAIHHFSKDLLEQLNGTQPAT